MYLANHLAHRFVNVPQLFVRSSHAMQACRRFLNEPLPKTCDPEHVIKEFRTSVNMSPEVGRE
jgi:hypothetical protein